MMRWTRTQLAEYLERDALVMRRASRRKYGNRPAERDGMWFDSQKELKRYAQLQILQKAGEIADLRVHPRFPLAVNGVKLGEYEADFAYRRGDEEVIEDCKGYRSRQDAAYRLFLLKARLVKALYGIEVQEV